MDNYPLKPESMRAPNNLSREDVRKSLDELDNKIKVLKGRANATTADSNNTYNEHIAALEKKRELIAQKVNTKEQDSSTWQDLRNGIDKLKSDVDNFFS
jgi:soluble cytochrome b562